MNSNRYSKPVHRYSKRHYKLLAGETDTLETQRLAELARKAGVMAHADTRAKFGAFTPENLEAVLRFQEERIAFHRTALGLV